ncbi:MBL fold metallo-hydrolase [Mycobacterium intracellulare]|uniref:Alkyl sulfatase dimerization domain-containing protein n=1 Tax=Mycobacterium intracellulare TaxID=1767 RepID=A0AAE4R8L1_MYCIT|nr:alkyl sulfatase dimerization domain-containing protein [Mycobacterium intracellulare]MCA2318609.1 MBL fold metallo-hydrolase [Mycobacterium intracellulare]MCA2339086.1 MBL fold metallo-hydrolase [Mycobacterium intracellulare]MDV6975542.1 alkyl sulfatase dimerization domain-containing protein [Mycobacterium intracellulare]MDV6980606.1 alkyl sulfatase dimerization domain-containing protein [Mycobacterium intracellulare]MDV7011035.1 alkyl sulfatase dimerization domain-containing protein [Mycob
MGSIHHRRPGVEAIAAASGQPATSLGDGIWMSPGVSNTYAVETGSGRIIINTGVFYEGPLHRDAYQAVPGPTHTIIVTQGHADHWGGAAALRDPDTAVVMHANYYYWRDDNERLMPARARNTAFAFEKFTRATLEHLKDVDMSLFDMSFPEPTITFDRHLGLNVGGRQVDLHWTPGGETTDALVAWLPDSRVLFTGNLFGPLFGHVPNLVTIRGDRYRDPIQYIEALDLVLSLQPDRLITGHFDPIEGADLIATEVTAMRDAMQWVHDRVIDAMVSGSDIYSLMNEIRLPERFDVGEGYGRTTWNSRAIWELYGGWFHHRSTTELFPIPPWSVAPDVVAAAGAERLVAAARSRLDAGQAVEALHLTDLILAGDDTNAAAKDVAIAAHERLLSDADNFWVKAWIQHSIKGLSA